MERHLNPKKKYPRFGFGLRKAGSIKIQPKPKTVGICESNHTNDLLTKNMIEFK
jgi:hypothetical protein